MRFEYVFILIVVRMTTSFLVPISFQRYASHSGSRSILWVDGNDGDCNDVLESLDHFVSAVESLNKKHRVSEDKGEAFQIVSRGSNDIPQNVNTETKVFYDPAQMRIFIAIFRENSEINISKICDLCSNNEIVSVPADILQSLCGFPIETLPPLGYHLSSGVSSCTTILDETLVQYCQDNDLYMSGGAGHPYWKLLLTAKAIGLLKEMEDVRIADVIGSHEKEGDEKDKYDQVWEISSIPKSDKERYKNLSSAENRFQSKGPEQLSQKPYFPIDGPSLNIARLVLREKDISNPLCPVFLTTVGRIGIISIRTKRSLRCEFLPPSPKKQNANEIIMNQQDASYPWKSATRDGGIMVDLMFGKVFLQSLGTKQGGKLIETFQTGQLLQIEAKTNPGQRESIQRWVDDNCLELTLIDCQLLSPSLGAVEDRDSDSGPKSGKKKKKIGTSSSLPTLGLDNIFDKYASIKFVDNSDSVSDFSNDISKVLSRLSCDETPGSVSPLVGIDCEWQPREFMENPNLPQPVLLLQVSFHELEKVHVLDLQALLRPLKPSSTPMNDVEREISSALSLLMKSKLMIKVGYQLSSDLRRIFASYPHLSCFQEVHSTLEIASVIKRVLHISKQKKSRYITMSLAAMTSHYLEMTLDKEHRKY